MKVENNKHTKNSAKLAVDMTGSEFDTALRMLGYESVHSRATALRVAPRTVEGYQEGREIPGPVRKLIEVMQENAELRREIVYLQRRRAA